MAGVGWSGGYVSDTPYVHLVMPELFPSHLDFVSTICGRDDGRTESFRYLELGCGQGLTSSLIAALNPDAEVVGVDFNPTCIANARIVAREIGLTNVRFLEADFRELSRRDSEVGGSFDYVVAHGVWSWVGSESHDRIVEFLTRALTPGGTFYVSYNTPVNWGAIAPLRKLMLSYAEALGGSSSDEKIRRSFEFMNKLHGGGAKYFADHPIAASWLALHQQSGADARYESHEYFNGNWNLYSFSDVAARLADAKLQYVGTTKFIENIDDLWLPKTLAEPYQSAQSVEFKENFKDVVMCRQFRKDVFRKGHAGLNIGQLTEKLRNVKFFSTNLSVKREYKFSLVNGDYIADKRIFDILATLSQSGRLVSGSEILDTTAKLGVSVVEVGRVLCLAIDGGLMSIANNVVFDSRIVESCRKYNSFACRQSAYSDVYQFLLSPVVGNVVFVSFLDRILLMLMLETGCSADDRLADHLVAQFDKMGAQMQQDNVIAVTAKQKNEQARTMIKQFQERYGMYKTLGMV